MKLYHYSVDSYLTDVLLRKEMYTNQAFRTILKNVREK